jgi:acyl-CoA synthetase (AMP-forming)/AMP-acid ligase II
VTAATIPEERAMRDPRGACVADEHTELDNAAFAQAVTGVAAVFAAAGLRRGGVLAIMLPNRVELVTGMFAAWRLGAAVTPVGPGLTAHEARQQIEDAAATLVLADEDATTVLGDIPQRIIGVEAVTAPARPALPPALVSDLGTLALLIYNGGKPGLPKGVMLDHANIGATAELVVDWLEMDGATRCLLVPPLSQVSGIMVSIVSPLLAGGSVFIAGRFDAGGFWATVEGVRPTFFSAVPAIHANPAPRPVVQPDTRSLRYVIRAAALMPPLIGEFEQSFGVPVVAGYGMPECTACCTLDPLRGPRKPGSVGLPLPGVGVRVVDASGRQLPAGEPGEVVVRGPNVMRGYLRRPDESADALRGGWLHTGDVGRFDEDGYLTLADRVSRLQTQAQSVDLSTPPGVPAV